MLKSVVMKLIELMIDAAPARCSEKIAKSTAVPSLWFKIDAVPGRLTHRYRSR